MHAKCLRSVSSVRDYFREYRAKKKVRERSKLPVSSPAADSLLFICSPGPSRQLLSTPWPHP